MARYIEACETRKRPMCRRVGQDEGRGPGAGVSRGSRRRFLFEPFAVFPREAVMPLLLTRVTVKLAQLCAVSASASYCGSGVLVGSGLCCCRVVSLCSAGRAADPVGWAVVDFSRERSGGGDESAGFETGVGRAAGGTDCA